ncbi:MAG TPA: hypothetical protein VH309_10040 [Elusimicrobiota bacterium]|jgi:hypothetical protein|nr:hypothetical protein [Elusimicrobiota bacterium]
MQKIRNAVIIIVLCVIGGYQARKRAALHLNLPPGDALHDSLAGNPTNASRPGLHLSNSDDDQLHDSVAGNAIPGFHHAGEHGNTEDGTPPPPRGGGDGGVGSFSGPNPASNLPPSNPLSPSGPASPSQPPK